MSGTYYDWRAIRYAPRNGRHVFIGWWDRDGTWQERYARWDARFTWRYDEASEREWYEGAWTDDTVEHWGCQERSSFFPTHFRHVPKAPPPPPRPPA
jgi:hypothetical protein